MVFKDYSKEYGGTDEEIYEKSKLNPAAIININLENLWKEAYSFQAKNELWKWNRKLDSIWLILGGDEPEKQLNDDKKDWVKLFNDIEIKIGETGSLLHKSQGFEQMSEEEIKKMAHQYRLLMAKSLFLRRLQNKQGKGTAYDTGEDDYMNY